MSGAACARIDRTVSTSATPALWTGTTTELFSRLYKKGFLASIPADQAGRAALKLLADRSPLVRRLHYRRWCFAFGDIHEPASALRGRLGVVAAE